MLSTFIVAETLYLSVFVGVSFGVLSAIVFGILHSGVSLWWLTKDRKIGDRWKRSLVLVADIIASGLTAALSLGITVNPTGWIAMGPPKSLN